MLISDWSSDVCSSDLSSASRSRPVLPVSGGTGERGLHGVSVQPEDEAQFVGALRRNVAKGGEGDARGTAIHVELFSALVEVLKLNIVVADGEDRSDEHTSELQSLMRISYAVFCLKIKNTQ